MIQLFNWTFDDIRRAIPNLKKLGYSHIHVSPPEKSNEAVWQWWGRYQPIDFTKIEGPLGTEAQFFTMTQAAEASRIEVIVDVVVNHTVDINEAPRDLVTMSGARVVADQFPQFGPDDFHDRCDTSSDVERCWLSNNLLDLRTENTHVRQVAKDYLAKLIGLGASGFRFDAAKHIEAGFFPDVLTIAPGKYAFGEYVTTKADDLRDRLSFDAMGYYDFPLLATMRKAFRFGGDMRVLKDPKAFGGALDGPKAVTVVRNHDVERGQNNDGGMTDGTPSVSGGTRVPAPSIPSM